MPTAEAVVAAPRPTGAPGPGSDPAPVRYAVLCAPTDPSGPWAAAALRARGLTGVRLVTVEEIVYSTRVVHRLGSAGVSTSITLPDGAVLGPDLVGVLNRVTAVPSEHLARSEPADRDYANQETYALLTSVLASLPGVVNPGGPRGLPGPWLSDAEWLCEGARAGLAGVGFRSGRDPAEGVVADRTVLVIGRRVLPCGASGRLQPTHAPPAGVAEGCRALARQVGTQVLGVDFAVVDRTWLLVRGHPAPDLRWAGPPAADALADLLRPAGGS